MRTSYKIVLAVVALSAISVVVSWFLAQDGIWYYWIFEVLGFGLLLVFGMAGLLLPMYYQSAAQGETRLPPTSRVEAPSGGRATISREELAAYWRSESRTGVIVFVCVGVFLGFLDGVWVYEVFFQPGQGIPLPLGAAIAIVLGGVVLALLLGGVGSFRHRPVALEISADGLRVRHAAAPDLAIQWSDRKLWLAVEDQSDFYVKSPQRPPWILRIGHWSSYGVSSSVAESILTELRARRSDVVETTIPVAMSGGKALRRYYVMP